MINKLSKLRGHTKKIVLKCLIIIIMLGLQPFVWRQVEVHAVEVHRKRSQKDQAGDLQTRIEQIKQVNEKQKEFLNQLEVVVPYEASLPQLVERLEHLATERGVHLTIQSIEEVLIGEEEDEVAVIPMLVTLQTLGRPADVLEYVAAVEHIQELNIIQSIALQPATEAQPTTTPAPGALPTPTLPTPYGATLTILFLFQQQR